MENDLLGAIDAALNAIQALAARVQAGDPEAIATAKQVAEFFAGVGFSVDEANEIMRKLGLLLGEGDDRATW